MNKSRNLFGICFRYNRSINMCFTPLSFYSNMIYCHISLEMAQLIFLCYFSRYIWNQQPHITAKRSFLHIYAIEGQHANFCLEHINNVFSAWCMWGSFVPVHILQVLCKCCQVSTLINEHFYNAAYSISILNIHLSQDEL